MAELTYDLTGKTAFVTGGSASVGEATVRAFAEAGTNVAVVDRATVEVFGSLDMAFNNAGIMRPPVDSADETEEAFDALVAVNLKGVWASMKHELKQMREQGSGAIVNCSSLGGLVGGDGRTTYRTTKYRVIIGATKSVALQYGKYGVRCNAVCPGTIDTPMV